MMHRLSQMSQAIWGESKPKGTGSGQFRFFFIELTQKAGSQAISKRLRGG
jgi:hypothetical protein